MQFPPVQHFVHAILEARGVPNVVTELQNSAGPFGPPPALAASDVAVKASLEITLKYCGLRADLSVDRLTCHMSATCVRQPSGAPDWLLPWLRHAHPPRRGWSLRYVNEGRRGVPVGHGRRDVECQFGDSRHRRARNLKPYRLHRIAPAGNSGHARRLQDVALGDEVPGPNASVAHRARGRA